MARKRTDLVLSMTLAETFLLLLFLVWLGQVVNNSGAPPVDPSILRIENEQLKADKERLGKENEALAAELHQAQLINEAFRKALHISEPITSPEQVTVAVDAARRGAPKCAPENVFARITIDEGAVAFTVAAADSVAHLVTDNTGIAIPTGPTFTDESEIENVLRAIASYSQSKGCRFDYILTYKTKADYYDGRERFERGRLFYAAGIVSAEKVSK